MSEVRLRRGELGPPGPEVPRLVTNAQHRVVVSWHKLAVLVEFEDALFRTNSAVVLPGGEAPIQGRSDQRRTTAGLAATCLRYGEEHPSEKVFVFGHADTKGTASVNQTLSQYRAECVAAVLMGDRQRFAEICATWKRMRVSDYKQILKWVAETWDWDCDPGTIDDHHTAHTTEALNTFRRLYNEQGPGSTWAPRTPLWGEATQKETWVAYFNMYEEALAEALGETFAGVSALRSRLPYLRPDRFVGCGESHPREAVNRDEYASQTNRRVEVTFFEPSELPQLPCHPADGPCAAEACDLYDDARYQRRVLPPMLTAKRWRARWDETEVCQGQSRRLVVDAPGLPPGEAMTFEVTQEGFGPIAEIETTSGEELVEAEFDEWFHGPAVRYSELGAHDPFPIVRYTFVVRGAGREVKSANTVVYADFLDVVISEDGERMTDHPYVLCSPWGRRTGARTDADGRVREERLPPGGVGLFLDENTILSFDQTME
ncbi:MAG: OmpA family protein [Myxococcales bacterium]|nr:OmpA family protein [Myxococcales bacterium]